MESESSTQSINKPHGKKLYGCTALAALFAIAGIAAYPWAKSANTPEVIQADLVVNDPAYQRICDAKFQELAENFKQTNLEPTDQAMKSCKKREAELTAFSNEILRDLAWEFSMMGVVGSIAVAAVALDERRRYKQPPAQAQNALA